MHDCTACITFTPEKDAYVAQYYPDTNFGLSPYLFTNRFEGNCDIYRAYIKFDLCSMLCNQIPPNSCITYACLEFPLSRNEVPPCDNTLYVYRVLQDWAEEGITWNNQPITALIPDGSTTITSYDDCINIDITELVNWWYSGFYANFGLQLRCDECLDSLLGFFSREYPNSDYWPRLTVYYYENCCCPFSNGIGEPTI
ncbi:MAG TPA: DNRLRE domain-containing protein [Syntrophomonadaceae bacterium]|nr:DNRLRE domain-containing protein [Syntrophomonadaceae bacterium]